MLALIDHGVCTAAAASSKNARPTLPRVRLDSSAEAQGLDQEVMWTGPTLSDFFDVDTGRDFAPERPDSEIFPAAVKDLGSSSPCPVVEDAAAALAGAPAGAMAPPDSLAVGTLVLRRRATAGGEQP